MAFRWEKFMIATRRRPPAPLVLAALKNVEKGTGMALDLGAGSGSNALALAKRGFLVNAVDFSGASIKELNKLKNPKIHPIKKNIKDFVISQNFYDVIVAWNSLSFLPKRKAQKVLKDIERGLGPDGVAIISMFGPRDEWAKTRKSMSFFAAQEFKKIFATVKAWEKEGDGKGVLGDQKHWHIIQCILKK